MRRRQVHILSTGSFLPGEPIKNSEIQELVGPLPPEVLDGVQVEQRHWMIDPRTGEHLINNSAMATEACRRALAEAGVDAADVQLLVVSTSSPDYLLPAMSTSVQQSLGLTRCTSIDVRSGCAGAVQAMDIARLYLERGHYQTALVVGSEAISPLLAPIFLGAGPDRIRMRDRISVYSFGDGAGAILLQARPPADHGPRGLLDSAISCVGGDRAPGMQVVGAGTHAPIHTQLLAKRLVELKVDVVASGKHTPAVIAEGLSAVLEHNNADVGSVDVCIIPEGNAGYLTAELEAAGALTPQWLGVADRISENLTAVGATGSAALPLALDSAWRSGAVEAGDRVLLLAIETSKWIYAGLLLEWSAGPATTSLVALGGTAQPAN
jgi:3-oxoacyl-[acyl-carrier-protein] synthase-3